MAARSRFRAVLVLCLTGLAACSPVDANSGGEAAQAVPEVAVFTVHTEQVELQTELAGRTAPFRSAEIRPQVTGIIKSRAFEEGSTVQEGQLLYLIEPAPYRAAFERARAELTSAQASRTTVEMRAKRYADLVDINAVSKQEYDDARAQHQQAVAQVEQARAALASAKINLDFTRLLAPIPGRIGRSSVTQGALVTAGQTTALAVVQQLDPIYVDVTQSSTQLLRLKRLLASGGALPASASVSLKLEDGSDYAELGRMQFTDVTVDGSTGSVTLRALFPNPDGVLLPGMYVRAQVNEAVDPHAILVPQQAVTHDEKGQASVLLVDDTGKVAQRTLTAERAVGDRWLIRSGLQAGDRVIVEGLVKVKPGQAVRVVATEPGTAKGS